LTQSHPHLLPANWIDLDLESIACIAPLQEISLPCAEAAGVRLLVKRDDLLHPILGGNKIYKLYGHLLRARAGDDNVPIATFGGAYSNHILALAAAGHELDIPTIGVIRGEAPAQLSPTLEDAQSLGMTLKFVSREMYRSREDKAFHHALEAEFGGPCYWVPEGGAGVDGVDGCIALARGILRISEHKPNYVVHACGSGTSISGLVSGFAQSPVGGIYTLGVSVLKNHHEMPMLIDAQMSHFGVKSQDWRVLQDFHCGGYAKYPEYLASFVQDLEQQTDILFDPVYTSKVMWAIGQLLEQRYFAAGSTVVMVHSGGLQGRRGFSLD